MILTFDYIRRMSGKLARRQPEPRSYSVRDRMHVDVPEASASEMPVALHHEGRSGSAVIVAQTRWDGQSHWAPLTGFAPGNPHGTLKPAELGTDYLYFCGVYADHLKTVSGRRPADFPRDVVGSPDRMHNVVEDDEARARAGLEAHFRSQLTVVDGVLHSRIIEPHYGLVSLGGSHGALVELSHFAATYEAACHPHRYSLTDLDSVGRDVAEVFGVPRVRTPDEAFTILVPESVTADMSPDAPRLFVGDVVRRAGHAFGGGERQAALEQLAEMLAVAAPESHESLLAVCAGFIETLSPEEIGALGRAGHGLPPERGIELATRRWRGHLSGLDDAPISIVF